ncbi:hypothetical protein CLI75_05745 [Porphyromonas gingivalis]|nr:hypothetical protein CS387_07815 [Porphyromonas gingivalis]EOA10590.1 hypothetical protein A343_0222 [Porphyromonas gingivalis JCVI SC001]PDP45899.1 hypothetical protein CLI82_08655 [Porphyromonas gingivalis]PDP55791.1 hypothetical protein CLI74_08205 [Porphyromonas gingivalis]PDP58142.1 hypothetical protein CLI75_05745 [Porphyromonas gingivalis]
MENNAPESALEKIRSKVVIKNPNNHAFGKLFSFFAHILPSSAGGGLPCRSILFFAQYVMSHWQKMYFKDF